MVKEAAMLLYNNSNSSEIQCEALAIWLVRGISPFWYSVQRFKKKMIKTLIEPYYRKTL